MSEVEDDSVLSFERRDVVVEGESRAILIARPRVEIRLDQERLTGMRNSNFVSRIDLEILQTVAERERDEASVVVFDARSPEGDQRWGFDPELDDEQRMELGHLLLKSQLTLYRRLATMKVGGLVGVGFGSIALAVFQRAAVRLVSELSDELETASPERAAQIEIDLWLVEHAATWTGLALESYLETKLAAELVTRERKRPEIEALLSKA
jgi:hypothetical protein